MYSARFPHTSAFSRHEVGNLAWNDGRRSAIRPLDRPMHGCGVGNHRM